MVLENATDGQGADTFTDSSPPSDDDPYSSTTTSSKQAYNIDSAHFPRPMPIFGPLFGYNNKLLSILVQKRIETSAAVVKRPLSQDEASATAFWAAKHLSIVSYGQPIGVAGGIYRWYTTMSSFQFPFFKPDLQKLNPSVWPSPKIAWLRGNRAVMAWHVLRLMSYSATGNFIGQVLFASYAMSVTAVGEMSDPRLKNVMDVLKEQASQKRGGLPGAAPADMGRGRQQGERQQSSGVGMGMRRSSTVGKEVDDASPTGGLFFDEVTESGKVTGGVHGGVGESSQNQPQTQRKTWPQHKPTSAQQQREAEDRPFSAFDDDAPPPNAQAASRISQSSQSQGHGSAWDRIRSGQKPSSTPNPQAQTSEWGDQSPQQQQQQPPRESAWARQRSGASQADTSGGNNDSFTASSRAEERRYDRADAQKEFDARIERERSGGDFAGSGSGDQKRW